MVTNMEHPPFPKSLHPPLKSVKYTALHIYVIEDLDSEEVAGVFYKKELQKKSNSLECKKK